MSFFDDASLAFLPSSGAGKDGKAYSIKPTTGAGDFTFSRGSNLAATRVGPTGLIEKGRENLLTYSNEFATSPWGVSGLETPTTGESGYDGTNNAWLLETSASSGRLRRTTSLSGVNTLSFYAKKGNVDYIAFFGISSSNFPRAWFNLATGNISNQLYHIDATMTPVIGATGWYRCSITFDEPVTELRLYPTNTAGSFSVGAGETSIIQDAQLEIGLAATDYIESGATTGKAGLLEDEPRFDYSGGATCPSLLLEPSRTQLFRYSEPFQNEGPAGNVTYESFDWAIGFVNCVKFGDNSALRYRYGSSAVNGTQYTLSAFVIMDDLSEPVVSSNSSSGDFCLAIGGSIADTINPNVDMGNNIWKISASRLAGGNAANNGAIKYTSQSNKGFRIVGWQMEAGSYATSYIPNHSGGSVTRGADYYANNSATDLIGQTEGVLFIDFTPNTDIVSTKWLSFLGSGGNYIGIYVINGTNKIFFEVAKSVGQASFASTSAIVKGQRYKCALAYKENDFVAYINGVQIGTDSSGSVPTTSTIRSYYNLSSIDSTETHQLLLFKERLSNADLATLTTL